MNPHNFPSISHIMILTRKQKFCGNNPEILLRAAKTVEGMCDLVDINFGCPQNIAKRGNYGAFLENQWDTIYSLGWFNVLQLKKDSL
jgi:tRNA-dihydrouridine synthase